MPFENQLWVHPLPNGKDWETREDYTYVTKSGKYIVIPGGFVTDFASVPWFFRRMFPVVGKYTPATVVHDWLYRAKHVNVTKEEADQIFLEIMIEAGVSKFTRQSLYRAVKIFGGSSFVDREVV